ncbi:hypothetical protein V8C86DRAFT_2898609 [Haematococcus lacustris]
MPVAVTVPMSVPYVVIHHVVLPVDPAGIAGCVARDVAGAVAFVALSVTITMTPLVPQTILVPRLQGARLRGPLQAGWPVGSTKEWSWSGGGGRTTTPWLPPRRPVWCRGLGPSSFG